MNAHDKAFDLLIKSYHIDDAISFVKQNANPWDIVYTILEDELDNFSIDKDDWLEIIVKYNWIYERFEYYNTIGLFETEEMKLEDIINSDNPFDFQDLYASWVECARNYLRRTNYRVYTKETSVSEN